MELDQRARPKRPPLPSWNVRFHLVLGVLRGVLLQNKDNLKRARLLTRQAAAPTPRGVSLKKVYIPRRPDVLPEGMDPKDAEGVVKSEWVDFHPIGKGEQAERVVLYVHGGAYFLCSRKTHRGMTWRLAKYCKARVLAVDYRLSPEATFPLPLNDVLSAYLYLIDPPAGSGQPRYRPEQITFMGDSAGGGLALACVLWLRDSEKYPMPGGMALLSPWLDLTHSMPSWRLNNPFDYLPDGSEDPKHINSDRSHYYVHTNALLTHPLVSPLFAEEDPTRPLPPTLIQCGDAEKLRDESITFVTSCFSQSPIQLELYEDMIHVFQMWAAVEALPRYALKRIGEFVRSLPNHKCDRDPPPQEPPHYEDKQTRVCRIVHHKQEGYMSTPVHDPMRIIEEAKDILVERGLWEGSKAAGRPVPIKKRKETIFIVDKDADAAKGGEVRAELDNLAIQVNPSVASDESD
ncbi:hypothetical protein HK104_005602 [Borealophlyctis nickersoniae]|nr:hypothetical protein HK104_005602 [Borealophlyctis nickersoniae]